METVEPNSTNNENQLTSVSDFKKLSIVKMKTLTRLTYGFNAVSVKKKKKYFLETSIVTLKFIWKYKDPKWLN